MKHILKMTQQEFPGSPEVRALCFHCRGHRFDPWSGNSDLAQSPVKLDHEVRVVRKQGQIMEDFGASVRT